MKKGLMALALCVAGSGAAAANEIEERNQASRAAVKEFADTLQGALVKAMKAEGPLKAIEVCNTVAPHIAHEQSEKRGWQVGRTTTKLRNEGNAPDAWELKVLQSFEERKARGEDLATMEHAEIVSADGQQEFRYMKAIPAGQPCLTCHGTNIDPAIGGKLEKLYPNDKARGYQLGDLRGAFTITQPM